MSEKFLVYLILFIFIPHPTRPTISHNYFIYHPTPIEIDTTVPSSSVPHQSSWKPLTSASGNVGNNEFIQNIKVGHIQRGHGHRAIFQGSPIADQSPWVPMIDESRNENSILSQFRDMLNSLEEEDAQQKPVDDHPCYRTCSSDPGTRLTCSYKFIVANYYILSPHCFECPNVTMDCNRLGCLPADGRQRAVAVVNKLMPGPAIRVCEGDTVIVDVTNKLGGQETTIHWHGIDQKDSPWMDGVPNLTQCPIPQGTTFRYQFDTPKAGTFFWHSHAGVQRADGVAGSLVVRKPPDEDIQSSYYDYDLAEHEIVVWDWLSGLALTGHIAGHVTDNRELPRSILVHGQGFPPGYFDDFRPIDTIQGRRKPFVPIHEVRIQQGMSYRFRIISNGVTLCPLEMSIENHLMLVIGSDGNDIIPVPVSSLVLQAGERFDVVIKGDQPVGSYWIKFRGLLDCNTTRTFQLAVLNYEGVPRRTLPRYTISRWEQAGPSNPGLQLNPVNIAPGIPGQYMTIAELSSIFDPDPEITMQEVADHQFYLSFDFKPVENINFGKPTPRKSHRQLLKEKERVVHFLPQLNFISHVMPMSPPLTQPDTIESIDRCNYESRMGQGINCTRKHCECVHWLTVPLNSIVEFVLVDMGITFDAAHPFHLHGHSFRVVGLERLGNSTESRIIKEWDEQGLLPRRRRNAPIKDTVYVPDGGYTILRFRANNPGLWFFHCHVEFHSERGMALILQVGDPNESAKPPPNLPKCGNYIPDVTEAPSTQPVSLINWQDYDIAHQYLQLAA